MEKPRKIAEKLYDILCCQDGCCAECFDEPKKHILTEKDIKHSFLDSVSGFDSSSGHGEGYRDRVDSDNRSRTDSTSSTGNIDSKRANIPVIDMKPIEFWTANKESIQPKQRRRLPSDTDISIDNFQKDLYEICEEEECLSDEQKLSIYQLGQIHFGLHYDLTTKVFAVKIIQAKDLPPPSCMDENRQDMSHSNPYCRVSLLPDQKNSHQTTVQRKTQNPEWDEYFMFEIPYKEAQMRTLEIIVKDFDRFSRHCIIGQVHLSLGMVNLVKGGHMWKPLSPSSKEKQDLGEILLSLNYLPSAGRMNVDIMKAKQIPQTDLVRGSDPFVKITMVHFEKPLKSKKTSCKKNTIDPVFNESISFNITQQQLENTSLVVTMWDYNSKSKDDYVGRIVLGKYGTGPHEITHWNRMMHSQRSPVAQWHSLRTRAECDQVSPASIAVP